MAYTKMILKPEQLLVGDVFRSVKCVGNLQTTFEWEVINPVVVKQYPHPKFPELMLTDVIIKVKNRHNGNGKTLKYSNVDMTVWRKA